MAESSAQSLNRISERATVWLARAGCVALTAMMVLTFVDVVGRSMNAPLIFTVEVTQLLMGLMVYLAMGYTTFVKGHINVDIIVIRLPPRIRAAFDVVASLVSMVFVVLVTMYLFERAGIVIEKGDKTELIRLPIWPVAYVMAISSVLMVTSLLLQFIEAVRAVVNIKPASAQ